MNREVSFCSTRWTLVRRVGVKSPDGARALSELCEIYYRPVHLFISGRVRNHDLADDLTHAFFESLLAKQSLGAPDPERGRFRTYLLGAVKHFLSREKAASLAAKRGGGAELLEFDDKKAGFSDDHISFDRAWAEALIARAYQSLEAEFSARGRARHFCLLSPWLDGGGEGDPEEGATSLGLSQNALKVAIHRIRKAFRSHVRHEISSTTSENPDDEFRYLIEVLT